MPVLYLLLVAAAYGFFCALYDLYRVFQLNTSGERLDFLPPQEGATVRAPKKPLPGGRAAEAEVEADGSAVSQVPSFLLYGFDRLFVILHRVVMVNGVVTVA